MPLTNRVLHGVAIALGFASLLLGIWDHIELHRKIDAISLAANVGAKSANEAAGHGRHTSSSIQELRQELADDRIRAHQQAEKDEAHRKDIERRINEFGTIRLIQIP